MHNYKSYSDQQLLELLKDNDEAAFEQIFNKHWQALYNSAFKLVKDRDLSKDVVNDVLLDLWERRTTVRPANLEAYLKTAIRFRAINQVTRNKRSPFFELFDSVAASTYSADGHLFEKEFVALIESWANLLPEKRRIIFIRHFFQNLNTREISDELNISQKTVQNQLSNSINYLHKRFGHLLFFLIALRVFYEDVGK